MIFSAGGGGACGRDEVVRVWFSTLLGLVMTKRPSVTKSIFIVTVNDQIFVNCDFMWLYVTTVTKLTDMVTSKHTEDKVGHN